MHQFGILNGASSSQAPAKIRDGVAAQKKLGGPLPSQELAGVRGASMNCAGGVSGKSLDGLREHAAASQRISASLPLPI